MSGDANLPGLSRDLLTDLHRRFGMDQWLVTRLADDESMVIASVGDGPVREGARSPWTGSIEAMVAVGADPVVGDVEGTTFQAASAVLPGLRSFAAATMRDRQDAVIGSLIGVAGNPTEVDAGALALPLSIAARTLSLIIDSAGGARDQVGTSPIADVRRDPMTGLLNQRGWQEALLVEDERSRRYGNRGSIAVIMVDGFDAFGEWDDEDAADALPRHVLLRQAGEALRAWARGADVLAHVDDSMFAVLLVEVWEEHAVAAINRMRETFEARRITVRVGLSDNSGRSLMEAVDVAAELAGTA